MKLKNKTVNIDNLEPIVKMSIGIAEKIAREVLDNNYHITVTSGNDGRHKKGSLHYVNRAVDIRTYDMKGKDWEIYRRIKKALGINFDVIHEGNHIHIEYDPK